MMLVKADGLFPTNRVAQNEHLGDKDMSHVQLNRLAPIYQMHRNPVAQPTNPNSAAQKTNPNPAQHTDRKPATQKGFWESHKFKIVTAIGIGIIAAIGIARLESARRFRERMNNLTMKCDFMSCKPNSQGIVPIFTSGYPCQCPPPEIAMRMKFPIDEFKPYDFEKEAHRVCNEGVDFIASNQQTPKEKVLNFCKRIKEHVEADEKRKGFYQKFLEAIHLI